MKWALILLVLTSCTTAHSSVDWDGLDYVDIKDEHTRIHGGVNPK